MRSNGLAHTPFSANAIDFSQQKHMFMDAG